MNRSKFQLGSWLVAIVIVLSCLLTSCTISPAMARERVFLDVSLDFLDAYQLSKMRFKDTPVGGLSALTYDRQQQRFYAVSDDRSVFAPARFYTLKLVLNSSDSKPIGIEKVAVEDVTFLSDQKGKPYPPGSLDTEGIALSPQQTVFISSEGVGRNDNTPFIGEFDVKTGQLRQSLPIPERYLPAVASTEKAGAKAISIQGIQDNLGFESLTLNPFGTIPAKGEPLRLFTATESALFQDEEEVTSEQGPKCRLLHYLLSEGPPLLISEHFYQLNPPPPGALKHGLADLLALDTGGHFLSLERSLGLLGFDVRIYQATTGGATDTSRIASLKGQLSGIQPMKKKLLLDLGQLGIDLDNFEGMTLGPRLPDGSQSLILVSDDNFSGAQTTKFLLFRLKNGR